MAQYLLEPNLVVSDILDRVAVDVLVDELNILALGLALVNLHDGLDQGLELEPLDLRLEIGVVVVGVVVDVVHHLDQQAGVAVDFLDVLLRLLVVLRAEFEHVHVALDTVQGGFQGDAEGCQDLVLNLGELQFHRIRDIVEYNHDPPLGGRVLFSLLLVVADPPRRDQLYVKQFPLSLVLGEPFFGNDVLESVTHYRALIGPRAALNKHVVNHVPERMPGFLQLLVVRF